MFLALEHASVSQELQEKGTICCGSQTYLTADTQPLFVFFHVLSFNRLSWVSQVLRGRGDWVDPGMESLVWEQEDPAYDLRSSVPARRLKSSTKKTEIATQDEAQNFIQKQEAIMCVKHWHSSMVFNFPSPGLGVTERNPLAAFSQYIPELLFCYQFPYIVCFLWES